MMLKRLKESVVKTPFFVPARHLYRTLFRRGSNEAHREMVRFYSEFISDGDLVFDIGANRGEYAQIFSDAGAKVIAVEPNTNFRERLTNLARHYNIVPEFCAVGDMSGTATLNICSEPGYSSLLPQSDDLFRNSPDHKNVTWIGAITVPVLTLDQLAAKHGKPIFVKIDVEGFEKETLAGMSFSPKSLSFEFRYLQKQCALNCISMLAPRGYKFCPILGREPILHSSWLTADDAKSWLERYDGTGATYGDMFARKG